MDNVQVVRELQKNDFGKEVLIKVYSADRNTFELYSIEDIITTHTRTGELFVIIRTSEKSKK